MFKNRSLRVIANRRSNTVVRDNSGRGEESGWNIQAMESAIWCGLGVGLLSAQCMVRITAGAVVRSAWTQLIRYRRTRK